MSEANKRRNRPVQHGGNVVCAGMIWRRLKNKPPRPCPKSHFSRFTMVSDCGHPAFKEEGGEIFNPYWLKSNPTTRGYIWCFYFQYVEYCCLKRCSLSAEQAGAPKYNCKEIDCISHFATRNLNLETRKQLYFRYPTRFNQAVARENTPNP